MAQRRKQTDLVGPALILGGAGLLVWGLTQRNGGGGGKWLSSPSAVAHQNADVDTSVLVTNIRNSDLSYALVIGVRTRGRAVAIKGLFGSLGPGQSVTETWTTVFGSPSPITTRNVTVTWTLWERPANNKLDTVSRTVTPVANQGLMALEQVAPCNCPDCGGPALAVPAALAQGGLDHLIEQTPPSDPIWRVFR